MNYYTHVESPLQTLTLTTNGTEITGLFLNSTWPAPQDKADWTRQDDIDPFVMARRQLNAYFDGHLKVFNLPIKMEGTPFQKQVWEELTRIPYGVTISYGELARRIGAPGASRAVGLANGRNPISIIVPCHRVVGANGKLTGYSGGLSNKQALLALEASARACPDSLFA